MSWAVTSNLASAMGNTRLTRMFGALLFARRTVAPLLLTASALLSACGSSNPFRSAAAYENIDRAYTLYALTGTSSALPAGYQFTTESIVRPQVLNTGSLNFDVAIDLDASGNAVISTAKKLVPAPPSPPASIGMLKLTAVYDQLTLAPDKGYVSDSTVTLKVGEAVLIRIIGSGCVYGEPFYAKMSIDEIDKTQRKISVRSLVNRNCGYRSLVAGVPTD